MAEYIDREALIQELDAKLCALHGELEENRIVYDAFTDGFEECVGEVGKFQFAADVAPVVHGRWIFGKDLPFIWGKMPKNKYHLYCSECLEQAFNRSEDNDPDFDVDTPYCHNCGAKMYGGED